MFTFPPSQIGLPVEEQEREGEEGEERGGGEGGG